MASRLSDLALLDCLRRVELEEFYPQFATRGITDPTALSKLTMQDYSQCGIVSMEDRKRLFTLIQQVKHELENSSAPPSVRNARNNLAAPPAAAAAAVASPAGNRGHTTVLPDVVTPKRKALDDLAVPNGSRQESSSSLLSQQDVPSPRRLPQAHGHGQSQSQLQAQASREEAMHQLEDLKRASQQSLLGEC
jgi:hypothetical protein